MADIKKEQERAELHKMIWNAATDLVHAGGVDAWDFKQYVLGTMFYRYISENITEYINDGEHEAGNVTKITGENIRISLWRTKTIRDR